MKLFIATLAAAFAFAQTPALAADPAPTDSTPAKSDAATAPATPPATPPSTKADPSERPQVGVKSEAAMKKKKNKKKKKKKKHGRLPKADMEAIDSACASDAEKMDCGGKKAGAGLIKCFKAYRAEKPGTDYSPECKKALKKAREDRKAQEKKKK